LEKAGCIIMNRLSESQLNELREFRRYLHRHPELSEEEVETAKQIKSQLEPLNPQHLLTDLGGHGLAAIFEGRAEGPTLLFRCELDALPIQEVNDFEHRSTQDGVAHKCGHDGHMSILLGLAHLIAEAPPRHGKVILLFQPAEENGVGAESMLQDTRVTGLQPDAVFALHNLPGFPLGLVLCREGSFTASVESLSIYYEGKTSHAGEPEKGTNPALAIAQSLEGIMALQQSIDQPDFFQVTPIQISMGEEAYGISAGHGVLRITIRSWEPEVLNRGRDQIEKSVNSIAAEHGLDLRVERSHAFSANQNAAKAVELIQAASADLGLDYMTRDEPFRWGEDFGLFTARYPGAMFGLGAGETRPALHNPDYDFPDELIQTGAELFHEIMKKALDTPW
jgi:amidohydrolase